MIKLIEKLRRKPEKTRRRIAFGTALASTSIIALVWFSVLSTQFNEAAKEVSAVRGPVSAMAHFLQGAAAGLISPFKR